MNDAVAGKIKPEDLEKEIQAAIDKWAIDDTQDHLHEHIGLTWEEWVDYHALHVPIEEIVKKRGGKSIRRRKKGVEDGSRNTAAPPV